MEFHLAQLNVALAKGDSESEMMRGFYDNVERVNTLAEASKGFVWRYRDEPGDDPGLHVFDTPQLLVNLSVWESLESLKHFMFQTMHLQFMKQKKEWFQPLDKPNYVLWYIAQGHIPDLFEAKERLIHLQRHAETPFAFSFKSPFLPTDR